MTLQKSPFLQNQRDFPDEDISLLCVQLDKSYIEIAQAVNSRVIGVFGLNNQSVTGEDWYVQGSQKQQSLREVYKFSDSNLTISHGIRFSSIYSFSRIWGVFLDGSGSWNTLPYVDTSSVNNQISVKVNSSNIVVTKGGGAPAISSGLIIIEWISVP